MNVGELSEHDADWAAGLMAERREVYATYSPVFWRPAPGDPGAARRLPGAPDRRPREHRAAL